MNISICVVSFCMIIFVSEDHGDDSEVHMTPLLSVNDCKNEKEGEGEMMERRRNNEMLSIMHADNTLLNGRNNG
jgi:hypothetical protein